MDVFVVICETFDLSSFFGDPQTDRCLWVFLTEEDARAFLESKNLTEHPLYGEWVSSTYTHVGGPYYDLYTLVRSVVGIVPDHEDGVAF